MRVDPALAFHKLRQAEIAARDGLVALPLGAQSPVGGLLLGGRPRCQGRDVVEVEVAARHGSDDASQRVEGGSFAKGGKSPLAFGDIAEHEKKFLRLCIGFIRRVYPKNTAKLLDAKHDIKGRTFRDWTSGRLPSCKHLLRLLIDHRHDFLDSVMRPLIAVKKVGAKAKRLKIRLPKFRRRQMTEAV